MCCLFPFPFFGKCSVFGAKQSTLPSTLVGGLVQTKA